MDDRYRSRKFTLAVSSLCMTGVGLYMGFIGGGEFVAAITVILGLYGAANVMDKK